MQSLEADHHQVEYKFRGKTYCGGFFLEDGWVRLMTHIGSKNAALHLSGTETMLRLLLTELGGSFVRIIPS
jgi:hypothetical protein